MPQVALNDLSEESERYLEACARIRGISLTRLLQRLLKTIADDQMVLSVLDDDSKLTRWMPGEDCKSHYRQQQKVTTDE